jgi:protein TonB
LRLSKQAWWFIGGGFGLGFLLFFMLWLDMRDNGNFYRAEEAADAAPGQVFEPLPMPQVDGGGRSASGLSEAAREIAANPRQAPAPEPVAPPPRPTEPAQNARPAAQRPSQALAAGSVPQPIERIQPKYPAEAMRRNETGTVVVRVEVGTDGEPADISIARSSRSRALDRAAMQAVRQWRFRPAQRDGQAVVATVDVPFDFSLQER